MNALKPIHRCPTRAGSWHVAEALSVPYPLIPRAYGNLGVRLQRPHGPALRTHHCVEIRAAEGLPPSDESIVRMLRRFSLAEAMREAIDRDVRESIEALRALLAMPTPEVAAVAQDYEHSNVQLARGLWKQVPGDLQPHDDAPRDEAPRGEEGNGHSLEQEQLAGARFYISFHLQGLVRRVGLPHVLV